MSIGNELALSIQGVSRKFKNFSLDNVSFDLPKGSIMGFVGENGAGKSTTINLTMDLMKMDSGSIKVFGQDSKLLPKNIKEDIGVVMDECCFPENLTVKEINKILKRIYKQWDEKRFWGYNERFNLPKTTIIKDYSRGMKMKLSIAVALSHDAKLLLLDEATSGLDPIVRDELLDVFLEYIEDENHSILMSSHIISDLEKVCDYITFIHKGKIVFTESKDDLLEKYGILKCSEQEFSGISSKYVYGYRKNSFGVEALVDKRKIGRASASTSVIIDQASIEDIMLYIIKEGR